MWPRLLALASLAAVPSFAAAQAEPDSDKDGLSDFQERHKYGTDPARKDSDGDGRPDGDADERREFAYSVRTRVVVLRPVTPEWLNDDFQDARVLSQTADRVELEVIHYPFSTANSAIEADPRWREHARQQKEWLTAGPTSNGGAELGQTIGRDLLRRGLDVRALDDRALVEGAARWLCEHARYQDGFTTFITGFKSGKPFVPGGLREVAERERAKGAATLEEAWKGELFAQSMYALGQRGSCTSSAIYLCGALRSLEIPTRIVLCIPLVDASDAEQMGLVRRLTHHRVREAILEALAHSSNSWTSHTLNEVWVGGRWRRLNYDKLGQDTLDAGTLGLMTHVATLHDWSDAKAWTTIGPRQTLGQRDAQLPHVNPYRAFEVSERFGEHARIPNEPVDAVPAEIRLDRLAWTDAELVPAELRRSLQEQGTFGVLAHVAAGLRFDAVKRFTQQVDRRFFLEAEGHPRISTEAGVGGVTWSGGSACWIVIPFGSADRAALVTGVKYTLVARNDSSPARWDLAPGLAIVRGR